MTTKLKQAIVLVNFSDISEVILKMKCESRGGDNTKSRRRSGKNYLQRCCNRLCFPVCMCVCVCVCAFVRRPT